MNVTVPYIGRELTVKVGALFYISFMNKVDHFNSSPLSNYGSKNSLIL